MDFTEKVRTLISGIGLLNKEEIEVLVEKTLVDSFEKGSILLRAGQIPTKCYMVVEGCVREYIIKEGEEKTTAFYTEGDSFNPNPQKTKPSPYFWECLEDSILTISNKSFEAEIRAALPRLEQVFQEMAIEKMEQAKAEWSQFISSSPEERYLHLLESRPYLLQRVPLHQIASYLGMKPQSLSRIRKRLTLK